MKSFIYLFYLNHSFCQLQIFPLESIEFICVITDWYQRKKESQRLTWGKKRTFKKPSTIPFKESTATPTKPLKITSPDISLFMVHAFFKLKL